MKKSFMGTLLIKKRQTGIPLTISREIEDLLTTESLSSQVSVELDGKDSKKFVGMIRVFEYYPKKTKKQ
jgi:hypothetical protein